MDYKALYEQQLQENKELKQFKKDVIDATQYDDDLEDQEYIDGIKEMESNYDPDMIEELKEENRELEASLLTWKMSRALRDTEIKELKEEIKELQEKLKSFQ